MRSVSVRLADLDRVKINLGIAGENEHTHVLFDCKKAFDQYPNATPFLIVTPPRGDIYPAVVTRDGDIVEWVVTDSDLIYHGNGKVQLQFKQGDIIMKSYEARTSIAISSEPTGTVPTPIQNWITQANAILASIPDDINTALAAAKASGEFDGADGVGIAAITLKSTVGLVDTYTITLTDGRDYDFTVTNGTPGQNGVGIQSIAKTSTVGLVDTYTVTLTNGQTYDFTVTNGQGSSIVIDDVTPASNKVFSSAKVAEELTDVLTAIQGVGDNLENFMDGWGEGEEIHLNLLDTAELTSDTKYYDVSNAGALRLNSPSGTVTYSSYIIPVKENQLYTANGNIRYIIPLDNSETPLVSRSQMIETARSIDTTNYPGTKYLAASFRTDNISAGYHWKFSEGDTPSDEVIPGGQPLPGWCQDAVDEIETEIQNLDIKPRKNRIYMLTDTSFSEEKKFTEFATSVKAKCMHLVVNLTSFTSVKVGLRSDAREVFYAQITDSAVNLYDYNGGLTEHTASYSHGLTIGDNLSIDVYAEANTGKYYVCVGSDGDEYTTTIAFTIAPTGLIYPFASMVGTASFVQFSAECNTQRPIWLFGDSYLGTNNTARWAYYLVNREKDSRVMMDAFAGENSTSALASLEALINSGVPDYIVWCLGMNDGGDTGTTPNATWLAKINAVIELCEENKVIPILATIPTVPSVNNEGKNAWVRESGHQYIDFAKAVGASDQGVWFTGMLSTDNVHPSVTGAITLYHAALAGCPQFNLN